MGIREAFFGRKKKPEAEPQPPAMKVVVVDHRSEQEKAVAEEGAQGIGVDPETDKVLRLMTEAYSLGERRGFGLYKDYPQYEKVRSIMQGISDRGGFEAMQRSYYYIRAQNRNAGTMLDGFWDGIGGWMK